VLHVRLNDLVAEAASNEALSIEDSVLGVQVALILGRTANQAL
jgi:hypothetical protein